VVQWGGGGGGYVNAINKPAGNEMKQLPHKILTLYFCLYTLIAVIPFYTCEEFVAWGSAHGTKYVQEFLCQKLSDIQTTISFTEGFHACSIFLLKKSYKDGDEYVA
jgi:hypothetical protein